MTALQAAAPERPTILRPVKKDLTLKKLGPNIRAVRVGRGYSQGDLAGMLDLAKQTISQWENGDCVPSLESLVRLSKALNVDATHILSGVSSDLKLAPLAQRRRDIASQIIPLYAIEVAGGILMGRIDPKGVEPIRHIPVAHKHPPRSIAFEVKGDAMRATLAGPSFVDGDLVTLVATTMAERGKIVLAHVGGEFVFRRFLPKTDGTIEGAVLRALNPDFQDVVMGPGDAILGVLKEHIRHY